MAILESITSLIAVYPKTSIIAIAVIVTFISLLVTMLFTDRKKMAELKDKQKACQNLMKQHKGNSAKLMEIQKEMMACSGEMMKMSFKPMLITMIPFIILFTFLRKIYVPLMGNSWIWYYIIVGIVSGMIMRKFLKI